MLVLCVDIGGSKLKGALVDERQEMQSDRLRCTTPRPAQPEPVLAALAELMKPLQGYDAIAIGFPGVVSDGVVKTAVNLHPDWIDFPLTRRVEQMFGIPTRSANDADIQGYGAIEGQGVELVVTLGTGMGSALFVDGVLVPNLEMGHHPFIKNKTYEQLLGNAPRKRDGNKAWNRRLSYALERLQALFSCRKIYLGGGNTRKVQCKLPDNVEIVSNLAGIYGGVELWRNFQPSGTEPSSEPSQPLQSQKPSKSEASLEATAATPTP